MSMAKEFTKKYQILVASGGVPKSENEVAARIDVAVRSIHDLPDQDEFSDNLGPDFGTMKGKVILSYEEGRDFNPEELAWLGVTEAYLKERADRGGYMPYVFFTDGTHTVFDSTAGGWMQ